MNLSRLSYYFSHMIFSCYIYDHIPGFAAQWKIKMAKMTHFDKGTLVAPFQKQCDYAIASQRDAGTTVSNTIV